MTSRLRSEESKGHVGPLELFFDLVYVFTIIQLSHYFLYHLDLIGFAQTVVLFLAVWWGWNYTAWCMNWLDPESRRVQALTAALMLAALTMAIAIPEAFTENAGLFVAGYLVLQLLRSSFMVFAVKDDVIPHIYLPLLVWNVAAAVVWIAGLAVSEEMRLAVWALAALVDYAGPLARFWIPGRGATAMSEWPVTESHLAERCRLVFIIALGESILIFGGTLADVDFTPQIVAAALVGFASIMLLWRLYFDHRHGNHEHEIPEGADPTAVARGAYAYAHALMVLGAILVAVGIEQVTHHPVEDTEPMMILAIVGGPALFLLGSLIFQRSLWGRVARSRLAGLVALAVVAGIAPWLPLVSVSSLVLAVLVALTVVGLVPAAIWHRALVGNQHDRAV